MFALDYRDARPIYTQLCDAIKEQILTGVLQEGDRLPSVRELAVQLTINPNTSQRAYGILESEGWIASVPGKGSFVAPIPATAKAQTAQLWAEMEALRQKFARLGIGTEEIIRYLSEGGNENA